MSSDIAIKIDNLSKCYQIYDQPRDRLKQFVLPRIQRALGMQPKQYFREFWALRGVSFEVKKGETVGIIGRNGSGKSTLLQMLCGTLNQTTGNTFARGRIAALLELGSGFNPEFTGLENIYLSGAILGLSKEEIDARFEAIANFADIGDFIHQPVKTYSSGMYVRLAFAVIAHVNAEILVIDEALAVGDAVFTQKCMRFLRQFKEHGTLIFVSHDMSSVLNLCERAIWLHQGQLRQIGESKEIAEAYLQYTLQEIYGDGARLQEIENAAETPGMTDANLQCAITDAEFTPQIDYGSQMRIANNISKANGWKTGAGEIISVELVSVNPSGASFFEGGEVVRMVITAQIKQDMDRPILGFLVRDRLGQDLFGENTLPFTDITACPVSAGATISGEFVFRLPMLPNGEYSVMTSLADGDLYNNIQHHWLHDAVIINVSSSKTRWGLVGISFEKVALKEVV